MSKLDLTCYIEGLYFPQMDYMISDSVTVNLRSALPPYSIIHQKKVILDNYGKAEMFKNIELGSMFYIQITHRNALETWSKPGGEYFLNGYTTEYNFSDSISKATGNNMTQKGNRYCLYSGDVYYDGSIDATDLSLIDNAAAEFSTGYLDTDLSGNMFVDGEDYAITDNNASNFISSISP